MARLIFSALLLLGLSGCATTPAPYGNFLQHSPAAYDQKMAEDAVKQLRVLYPPASTRFDLQQTTPDAFGATLVEVLRAKGYALLEFKPEAAVRRQEAPMPSAGLSLRYILDQDPSLGLYRVTLLVGQQAITRAYLAQDSTVYPAGAWAHKE